MTVDEIKEIMKAFSDSEISYLEYEGEDSSKLLLEKQERTMVPARNLPVASSEPQFIPAVSDRLEGNAAPEADKGGNIIKSPLVGTFYSSASPEAEPFVKVGDHVKKGQVLGIIEAMKLMNDIESEYDGEIEEILVNNKDMVEYDQPLFRIK